MSGIVVNGLLQRHAAPLLPDRGQAWLGMALVGTLTVVMTATGACDTDNLAPAHRFTLWLVICGLVVGQSLALGQLSLRLLPARLVGWRLDGVLAIVATVVLTATELHFLKFTPLLPKEPDPPLAFLLFIAPIVGPMALLALLLIGRPGNAWPAVSADQDAPGTADPVTDWPAGDVLRISAEDHYLRIHTTRGERLVRGRMKDALLRVTATKGLQIHRSHWIAREQLLRVVRKGRDYRAILQDGTSLPISRGRVSQLRDSCLLS